MFPYGDISDMLINTFYKIPLNFFANLTSIL